VYTHCEREKFVAGLWIVNVSPQRLIEVTLYLDWGGKTRWGAIAVRDCNCVLRSGVCRRFPGS